MFDGGGLGGSDAIGLGGLKMLKMLKVSSRRSDARPQVPRATRFAAPLVRLACVFTLQSRPTNANPIQQP
jgi:hypothetical protein